MKLAALLIDCQSDINGFLTEIIAARQAPSSQLNKAMHYALVLGGKRVRPFLTLQIAALCGAPPALARRAAAAVECIHAYSLIHDDLPAMDDDVLRRGQPSCHIAFDEATAILAGDALQSLAFELLSEPEPQVNAAQQLAMVQCLAIAAGDKGMCGGQSLDLEATARQLTQAQLEQVHQHKTGALIRAAAQLGVLAGSESAQRYLTDFDAYATHLGLAFQVQDDILDVTSSTEALGKTQGSDLNANKATYVQLLGLDDAKAEVKALHQKALHALGRIPYNTLVLEKLAESLLTRDH